MKTEIEDAMKNITKKIGTDIGHHEAMQYSQAVLNLAHAQATLDNIEREKES